MEFENCILTSIADLQRICGGRTIASRRIVESAESGKARQNRESCGNRVVGSASCVSHCSNTGSRDFNAWLRDARNAGATTPAAYSATKMPENREQRREKAIERRIIVRLKQTLITLQMENEQEFTMKCLRKTEASATPKR